jgi:hypothetical protein
MVVMKQLCIHSNKVTYQYKEKYRAFQFLMQLCKYSVEAIHKHDIYYHCIRGVSSRSLLHRFLLPLVHTGVTAAKNPRCLLELLGVD